MKRILSVLLVLVLTLSLPLCLAPQTQAATKLVAITFDDGPSGYTAGLLDGLKARGAKATFFVVGNRIGSYPETMRRLVREGHQIANHTTNHPQLTTLSASSIRQELNTCENKLKQYGGNQMYCLRPPYGSYNSTVRQQSNGPLILWSVDTLDWQSRNATAVYNKIINNTTDGSIVLLHDLYSTSVSGALRAIDTLKARGYEFVTVNELFRRRAITMQKGSVYSAAYNKGITLPAVEAPVAPSITVSDVLGGKTVSLTTTTKNAEIHYTTDGSKPSEKSKKYSGAFTVKQNTTIRAVAYNSVLSKESKKSITVPLAAAPTATYNEGKLTLTAAKGTTLYYTVGDGAPTTSSAVYSAPIAMQTACGVLVRAKGAADRKITYTLTKYGALFSDISHKAWYYNAVSEVVQKGIMVGTANQNFAPDQKVSRAMFITALYRMSGERAEVTPLEQFEDADMQSWYAEALSWGVEKEIVKGMSEHTFAPNDNITREQMCAFICRFLAYKQLSPECHEREPFADEKEISFWALQDVMALYEMELINGRDNAMFCPASQTTRAECAQVLVNLLTL